MTYWSSWAPVVAALGSSALTGTFTWGVSQWQQRQRGKDFANQERAKAYKALLVCSLDFANRAQTAGLAMRLRSGLTEGIDVTLGRRKPIDLLEFFDWLDKSLQPLTEAWMQIWVAGSQEAIDAADQLVAACNDLLGAATPLNEERGWFVTIIRGQTLSKKQLEEYDSALKRIARARVTFAALARKETGSNTATFALERSEIASR